MTKNYFSVEVEESNVCIKLEQAGADCIVMCTNTPHLVADTVRKKIKIPLLHIAEETAKGSSEEKDFKGGIAWN